MTLTKTAIIHNDKVLMSTADTANLFGKNLDSTKARPAYCKHFSLKWVQQWVKNGLEIKAAYNHASKT
jgi:hypothetical protein